MVKLAFYKGEGNWVDKTIRWWTKSHYSHVELVINSVWYSSSPRTLEVRGEKITPNPKHWDYIILEPFNESSLIHLANKELGKKYDWMGIFFSQFIPLGRENPNKWFCSEFCVGMLKDQIKFKHKPSWYSPGKLYEEIKSLGK